GRCAAARPGARRGAGAGATQGARRRMAGARRAGGRMSDRPKRAPEAKRPAVSYSQIPEQAPRVATRRHNLLPLAIAFLAGWAIMQIEILGGRVLAPFFGYSIYQWGALIGVVMAALAAGYALGGVMGDRPRAR